MAELPALSDLMRDVLDLALPTDLQLSPDGKSVAYSTVTKWKNRTAEHPSQSIWVADVGVAKSARTLTDGAWDDRQPAWAPDGGSLAFLSDRGERGKTTAIYLLEAPPGGGATPRALTPAKHERSIAKLRFSPDGKKIAFAAASEKSPERKAKEEAKDDAQVWGEDWDFARLFLCSVEDGSVETVFEQDAHVYDFDWSDDGTQIVIATNPTPHIESEYVDGSDLSIIDLKSGEVKTVWHHGGAVGPLLWAGSTLFFVGCATSWQHNSGFVVYSVSSVDENPSAKKVGGYGENSCAMSLTKVGNEVLVKSEAGMEDQLRLLSGNLIFGARKKISDCDAVKPDQDNDITLVIAQGDMNKPTEVYSVAPSGDFTQLSDHGSRFAGKSFGACLFLECQSLDSKETLEGLFVTPSQHAGPDGRPTRPLPTLVLLHGGPYSRSTDAFDQGGGPTATVPAILAQGHAVFMPNYRGSSGRGDRFCQYTNGGMGIYDEPDVVALTQAAIDAGYADPDRLVAGGWSQGGHLAYLSAVRNGAHGLGWRFRGIIAGAGVTDWDTMVLTSDLGVWQAQAAGAAPWQTDGTSVESRSGSALWEFKRAADEGRIPPMLMVHGSDDPRVPITQAWGFRRALTQAGLPFEFVTYPRQGHHFQNRKHFEDLIRRTLRFLQTHLGE